MATVLELVGPEAALELRGYTPMHIVVPAQATLINRITEYLQAYGPSMHTAVEVRVSHLASLETAARWQQLAPAAVKIVEVRGPQ